MSETLVFQEEAIRRLSEYRVKAEAWGLPTFSSLPLDDYYRLMQAGIGNRETTISFMRKDRKFVPLGKRKSLPESLRFSKDPRIRLASMWYCRVGKTFISYWK